jgi:hypothetical protein
MQKARDKSRAFCLAGGISQIETTTHEKARVHPASPRR